MTEALEEALFLVKERSTPGNPYYYKPFDPQRSRLLRAYYRSQLPASLHETGDIFFTVQNRFGTKISRGYHRIVVGDYGAYLELSDEMVYHANLRLKFATGIGNKYNWLVTKDAEQTKVYEQLGRVRYADYRPNCFYVAPGDIVWPG